MAARARLRSPHASYMQERLNQLAQSSGASSTASANFSNSCAAADLSTRPEGLRGRVSSGSLPAAASSSASFWMRAPKIISRTNAHAPTAGNSSSPTPRTVPAILPETSSITPRCAVKSRYNPSSATVRAAKVFPLPPASTTKNTPLKSNTPSMKARAPNGTGSNSTVAAKRMQASALQSRNDKKSERREDPVPEGGTGALMKAPGSYPGPRSAPGGRQPLAHPAAPRA